MCQCVSYVIAQVTEVPEGNSVSTQFCPGMGKTLEELRASKAASRSVTSVTNLESIVK